MTLSYSHFRKFAPAALAIAAVLGPSTVAVAEEGPIVVRSEAAMEQWSGKVTRALDRQLLSAERRTRFRPQEGIVQFSFTLDADGRAKDFEMLQSTGHYWTDRLAQRALSNLRDLDEAPVEAVMDQTFLASVIFAKTQHRYDELRDTLDVQERERLAEAGQASTYIALTR